MNTGKETSENDKVTPEIEENLSQGNEEITDSHSATEQKENDQIDHENHENQQEIEEEIDYSTFSKSELLAALKEVTSGNFHKAEGKIHTIKALYDERLNKEKEDALKDFTDKGGEEGDFEYKFSEEDREFLSLFNGYKEKKINFLKDLEKQKENNLSAKNQILDTLRNLVDGEETTHSITTIKDIQEHWKKIGPVPNSQNRGLWASYNALMDRFYDNRSIYFELKELDRKKNLEQKIEICEKAEALVKTEELKEAIKSLNDLHEEYKHIGPVPREEQEKLWQRFKAASDAVYSRRKEFFEEQKEVFEENLKAKEAQIEKLESYNYFNAPKIKDWNAKTKEVLAIQKEWETIGTVPKELAKEINKKFWGLFKQFFHNKNLFFKELDEIRLHNKNKAEELIQKAEDLMGSTDWQNSASKLIELQQEWRNLGPTPEKNRNELYTRFKSACDTFFENRRNANKQVNNEFVHNLTAKEGVCKQILDGCQGTNVSAENLEALIAEFNSIGFVPRKNMKEITAKFNEAVDKYVKILGSEGVNREELLFRLNLNRLQADPNSDKVLNKKEHGIRKQITDLENNITLWQNNLEFFASSKTADKLKDQFDDKISKAEKEIEKLKKKLSIIREF